MSDKADDLKKTQEELASNYALQVALQTMKERCQQLQVRLSVVEEENLQLKIEKQKMMKYENRNLNTNDIQKLHEQVAQLTRQKCQLTHHIYMVATENKNLWTSLSLLTETNESLSTRLNKISNALSNRNPVYQIQSLKDLLDIDTKLELSAQIGSMEDISLKLNHEMKSPDSHPQNEISETQSIKDYEFTLNSSCSSHDVNIDDDEDSQDEEMAALLSMMSQDMSRCKKKLMGFLSTTKQHRNTLKYLLNKLRLISEGKEKCTICWKNVEKKEYQDVATSFNSEFLDTDEEVRKILQKDVKCACCACESERTERICPICGKTFVYHVHLSIFVDHVRSHFQEEDDDRFQSDSLLFGGSSPSADNT